MSKLWKEYFEQTKNDPPRPLLIKALSFVKERNNVLDLGAGALNDSIYLLGEGFKHVTAVDKEPMALEIAKNLPSDKFEYVIKSFETFEFPKEKFDLINAQCSLPFISPKKFDETFKKIILSLKLGGIFVGQFFGDRDGWIKDMNMTFQTREEVEKLLSDFEVLSFEEEEEDKVSAVGKLKHWHIFHFIVRKK